MSATPLTPCFGSAAVQSFVKGELANAKNARLDLLKFNRKVVRDVDKQASAAVQVVAPRVPAGLSAVLESFSVGAIQPARKSTKLEDALDGSSLVYLEGDCTPMGDKLKGHIQMKAHTKWMAESLGKDANRTSVFCEYKAEMQQFLDREIRAFMRGNGWEKVFTRGVRGTTTDTDFRNVWSMQHWMAEAQHVNCSVSPMGLADVRVLLGGEELLLGFRIVDVPGIELKHKMTALQQMDGDNLITLLGKCGWLRMHNKVGSTVVLPSGFICFSVSGNLGSEGVRWSFLDGRQDLQRVRNSVGMLLASYPPLGGTVYKKWKDLLDEAVEEEAAKEV
jgi:hypothetical protein